MTSSDKRYEKRKEVKGRESRVGWESRSIRLAEQRREGGALRGSGV